MPDLLRDRELNSAKGKTTDLLEQNLQPLSTSAVLIQASQLLTILLPGQTHVCKLQYQVPLGIAILPL